MALFGFKRKRNSIVWKAGHRPQMDYDYRKGTVISCECGELWRYFPGEATWDDLMDAYNRHVAWLELHTCFWVA